MYVEHRDVIIIIIIIIIIIMSLKYRYPFENLNFVIILASYDDFYSFCLPLKIKLLLLNLINNNTKRYMS